MPCPPRQLDVVAHPHLRPAQHSHQHSAAEAALAPRRVWITGAAENASTNTFFWDQGYHPMALALLDPAGLRYRTISPISRPYLAHISPTSQAGPAHLPAAGRRRQRQPRGLGGRLAVGRGRGQLVRSQP